MHVRLVSCFSQEGTYMQEARPELHRNTNSFIYLFFIGYNMKPNNSSPVEVCRIRGGYERREKFTGELLGLQDQR